jgi:hypothetical protein
MFASAKRPSRAGMWQEPVEPFLHGGLGLLPLATLCRTREGKSLADGLRDIVQEIDRRLVAEAEHARDSPDDGSVHSERHARCEGDTGNRLRWSSNHA